MKTVTIPAALLAEFISAIRAQQPTFSGDLPTSLVVVPVTVQSEAPVIDLPGYSAVLVQADLVRQDTAMPSIYPNPGGPTP